MNHQRNTLQSKGRSRRGFIRQVGVGVLGAQIAVGSEVGAAVVRQSSRSQRLKRIASNSYAVRHLFRRRPFSPRPGMSEDEFRRRAAFQAETVKLKKQYGEITLLDFPRFTRDTYEGVTKMDVWSSLFGDLDDESQFSERAFRGRRSLGFDPSTPSSRRYLDRFADHIARTGV